MPTVSKKQEKFMQAVANNPEFAEKVGVNQSIGREFIKGKDMKKNYMYGGKVKKMNMGGRTGDMMYSRGYGVGKKDKRMPTELNMGGKVKKMVGGGKAMGTGAMMGGMADKAGARAMSPAMKKRMEMAMMKAGAGGAAGGMKKGGKVKGYGTL